MGLGGILFDLDGTLADTAQAERLAWPDLSALFSRHAPQADPGELASRYQAAFEPHWTAFLAGRIDFSEYRRRRVTTALAPWVAVDDELFELYRAEKRRGVERLEPFADAVETLRALRSLGLAVGLLSNGPSGLQRRKLALTGLAAELDAIAISEEIGVAKPDPGAFRTAASLVGCDVTRVAMVGDSPEYDVAGALAAGVARAVLVRHGLPVDAPGAVVVETLGEVPAALGLAAGRQGQRAAR